MGDAATGIEVSRSYFEGLVRPLLASRFPDLAYAAGRLGSGSDVLGLDDATSRDHDWGLRLTLIVPEDAVIAVEGLLEAEVPEAHDGLPTRFRFSGEDADRLHVDVRSMAGFLTPLLGFDPRTSLTTADWLSLTGQAVLEATAGPVFADADGQLTRIRALLDWYPEDVWRFALASDWARIAQEMPLMSRAADLLDDRGSRVVAARLAQVAVHLAFLIERRWPPYSKWLGTMFRSLRCAPELGPLLDDLLGAGDRVARERALVRALDLLLEHQRCAGLSSATRATVRFWDRPSRHPDPVIVEQLMAPVRDEAVRALRVGLGTVEQRTDNVDLLVDAGARRRAVGASA